MAAVELYPRGVSRKSGPVNHPGDGASYATVLLLLSKTSEVAPHTSDPRVGVGVVVSWRQRHQRTHNSVSFPALNRLGNAGCRDPSRECQCLAREVRGQGLVTSAVLGDGCGRARGLRAGPPGASEVSPIPCSCASRYPLRCGPGLRQGRSRRRCEGPGARLAVTRWKRSIFRRAIFWRARSFLSSGSLRTELSGGSTRSTSLTRSMTWSILSKNFRRARCGWRIAAGLSGPGRRPGCGQAAAGHQAVIPAKTGAVRRISCAGGSRAPRSDRLRSGEHSGRDGADGGARHHGRREARGSGLTYRLGSS